MAFRRAISLAQRVMGLVPISEAGLAVAILAVFSLPSGVSQSVGSAPTLPVPRMQKQLATALDGTTWNARKWLGGSLVVFHQGIAPTPTFGLYGSDDRASMTGVVSFPDSNEVSISDVTVDEKRNVYVSGGAMSSSGVLGQFIEEFDPNGKSLGVIRTNPFVAQQVCAIGDGRVWALGFDREIEKKKGDYAVLRRFDFGRGEVTAILQRSTVSWNFMRGHHHSSLVCNPKSVGLYLPYDNLWFEANADGTNSFLRQLPSLPSNSLITGSAFTESSRFFVTVDYRSRGATGLFELQTTDATHATYSSVTVSGNTASDLSSRSRPVVELLGSGGNDLVYLRSRSLPLVYWSAAP